MEGAYTVGCMFLCGFICVLCVARGKGAKR